VNGQYQQQQCEHREGVKQNFFNRFSFHGSNQIAFLIFIK
jgi:hypothetical protein